MADSDLPPLYAGWMLEALGAEIPRESEATCLDCRMCPKEGRVWTALDVHFDSGVKCCTYIPYLPNYLVGGMLGEPSVEARIDAKVSVSPMGVGQSKADQARYGVVAEKEFGRAKDFRCPHYKDGMCGVWAHRPSVCATWFCRTVRGATGGRFWKSMHRLLTSLEKSLIRWCLLDFDVAVLERLFPHAKAGEPVQSSVADHVLTEPPVTPEAYRAAWGPWEGREREFYRECSRRVQALRWKDVLELGGAEGALLLRLAQEDFRRLLSTELPPVLVPGGFEAVPAEAPNFRFKGYSPYDPIDLPAGFIQFLGNFDGRPTEAILQLGIPRDLLLKIVDFGLVKRPD